MRSVVFSALVACAVEPISIQNEATAVGEGVQAARMGSFYATCSGIDTVMFTATADRRPSYTKVWAVGTADRTATAEHNPEPHAEEHTLDHVGPAGGAELSQRSLLGVGGVSSWEPSLATGFPCTDGTSTSRHGYPSTSGGFGGPPEITYVVRLLGSREGVIDDCSIVGHDPEGLASSVQSWWDGSEPRYTPDYIPEDIHDWFPGCYF